MRIKFIPIKKAPVIAAVTLISAAASAEPMPTKQTPALSLFLPLVCFTKVMTTSTKPIVVRT